MIIPKTISNTYSLSIMSTKYGFVFGKISKVIIYANNHLAIDKILKTKPFLLHLINDKKVIKIYIRSMTEINSKESSKKLGIKLFF